LAVEAFFGYSLAVAWRESGRKNFHHTQAHSRAAYQPVGETVAANCDVCGKGPGFGHNVSHAQNKTKRRWNPNIQRVRAIVAGTRKRVNVCTSCLKAGKVQRAVSA
jgi:large subunit ribosomal protein L28